MSSNINYNKINSSSILIPNNNKLYSTNYKYKNSDIFSNNMSENNKKIIKSGKKIIKKPITDIFNVTKSNNNNNKNTKGKKTYKHLSNIYIGNDNISYIVKKNKLNNKYNPDKYYKIDSPHNMKMKEFYGADNKKNNSIGKTRNILDYEEELLQKEINDKKKDERKIKVRLKNKKNLSVDFNMDNNSNSNNLKRKNRSNSIDLNILSKYYKLNNNRKELISNKAPFINKLDWKKDNTELYSRKEYLLNEKSIQNLSPFQIKLKNNFSQTFDENKNYCFSNRLEAHNDLINNNNKDKNYVYDYLKQNLNVKDTKIKKLMDNYSNNQNKQFYTENIKNNNKINKNYENNNDIEKKYLIKDIYPQNNYDIKKTFNENGIDIFNISNTNNEHDNNFSFGNNITFSVRTNYNQKENNNFNKKLNNAITSLKKKIGKNVEEIQIKNYNKKNSYMNIENYNNNTTYIKKIYNNNKRNNSAMERSLSIKEKRKMKENINKNNSINNNNNIDYYKKINNNNDNIYNKMNHNFSESFQQINYKYKNESFNNYKF